MQRRRTGWILAASLLSLAAGTAMAQPAKSARPDGQVGFQRRVQLAPAEEMAESETVLSKMEGTSTTIRHQLEQARAQRDVVKTLCLNDKLSQIDVAVRSARDRKASLQAAVSRNDSELANHEFTIMTVLRQRAEQLSAEANQCIGEETAFIGQTQVVTQIDPNLPGTDPGYSPPADPVGIVTPPPAQSPAQ